MRQIYVNGALKRQAENFSKTIFSRRRKDFIHPKAQLQALHDKLKIRKHAKYRTYIQKIINEYEPILAATPQEMKTKIAEFEKIVPSKDVLRKIASRKYSFYEQVVQAMRYEDLRDVEFLEEVKQLNIKTCVYCNAQLTVVVDVRSKYGKKSKKPISLGKFDLDHFYAKSTYPFLCTTFFNLYPSCPSCNRAKSSKVALFQLYTEDKSANLDVLNFKVDNQSIIDYWISRDSQQLKVDLRPSLGNLKLYKNHNELFRIQEIYNTQLDIAEELVHKAKIYSPAYKKQLINAFGKHSIFPDISMINRLIVGNYTKPEDVHKRPMCLYMQNLAKQLGLL
ncbi:hypothetical protein [Dysgonomonas sp. 520]|uniref:hypothetical protein n=1 Tax=Dysgonomonas sp. 520 TaxID=2302931 RepID=UPI0013D8D1F1|nr:hypothetical protein [Dysgonomonas sp. 520]MDL2302804.1 hypothetical protein [Dysgonomonas sp. OttesenSCG-928-D17]NDW10213.1 hypothetical protein [Dysgonomonas sp. 520]